MSTCQYCQKICHGSCPDAIREEEDKNFYIKVIGFSIMAIGAILMADFLGVYDREIEESFDFHEPNF
jgi:hypothetical protein